MVRVRRWFESPHGYAAMMLAAAATLLVAVSPAAAAPPGQSPTGFHITSVTTTTIAAAWDLPGDPALGTTFSISGPPNIGGGYLLAPGSTQFTALGLTCGTTYLITVAYRDDATGETGPTAELAQATAACTGPPPSPPTGLDLVDATGAELSFAWDAPADADVWLTRTDVEGPPFASRQAGLDPSTLDYTMTGGVCGTTYHFAIYFIDTEGQYSPSASINAQTEGCELLGPAPAGPAQLRVTSAIATHTTLGWDPPTDPEVTYTRITVDTPGAPVSASWKSTKTTSATISTRGCDATYTAAVAWLFSDGRLSTPATAIIRTAACPPPPAHPALSPPALAGSHAAPSTRPQAGAQVAVSLPRRPRAIRVGRSGRFTIAGSRIACPADAAGACAATVTVTTRTAAGTLRLAATRLTVAPGRAAPVSARLSRSGRSALRRRRHLKARVAVQARRPSGAFVRRAATVTLYGPLR